MYAIYTTRDEYRKNPTWQRYNGRQYNSYNDCRRALRRLMERHEMYTPDYYHQDGTSYTVADGTHYAILATNSIAATRSTEA